MPSLLTWVDVMQKIDAARKPEDRCAPEVVWRKLREVVEKQTPKGESDEKS